MLEHLKEELKNNDEFRAYNFLQIVLATRKYKENHGDTLSEGHNEIMFEWKGKHSDAFRQMTEKHTEILPRYAKALQEKDELEKKRLLKKLKNFYIQKKTKIVFDFTF